MAEKKRRQLKKVQTVRQKAEKAGVEKKPRRLRRASSVAAKPFKTAGRLGRKELHPIKLPDNKVGRFMTKSRRVTPNYFVQSWQELKQVKWPTWRETTKLSFAVFIFAIFFGAFITILDYGLDKAFKSLFLK